MILGAGRDLTVIDAADYKTKDAQAARKAAYAEDGAPILRTDLAKAERSANRILAQIAAIPGCEGFATAPAEIVAVVRDTSGAWLRIMMDRVEIHATHAIIWDLKTSSQSAAPQGLGRRVEQMDMETQAALYVRVLETLLPRLAGRIRFRWIFVETDTPNALSVAEADNVGMTVGARKTAAAIHLWNRCMKAGEWPGYALLQRRIPIIFSIRGEETVKPGENPGEKPTRVLKSVCNSQFPYEVTVSFRLEAERKGYIDLSDPKSWKMEGAHQEIFKHGDQLSEAHGAALAAWARGERIGAPAQQTEQPRQTSGRDRLYAAARTAATEGTAALSRFREGLPPAGEADRRLLLRPRRSDHLHERRLVRVPGRRGSRGARRVHPEQEVLPPQRALPRARRQPELRLHDRTGGAPWVGAAPSGSLLEPAASPWPT